MSKKERRIAFGAGVSHATALAAEAEAERLKKELAARDAATAAHAQAQAAAAVVVPVQRPATPALDRLCEIEKVSPLLAASHAVAHEETIRTERAALAQYAAGSAPPAAPANAPPPVAPVAPVPPQVKPRTWRDHYEEVRLRDPYQASAILLQAHSTAGTLDAPLPAVTP